MHGILRLRPGSGIEGSLKDGERRYASSTLTFGGPPMPTSVSARHDPFPVAQPYHGIYSHGVETRAGARVLHVSGQVGQPPEGDLPPDFRGQCRQAIRNLFSVLEA